MSEVLEGIVLPVTPDVARQVYRDSGIQFPAEFFSIRPSLTAVVRDSPRSEYRFSNEYNSLASEASRRHGAVVVFRYDSRVGFRSSDVFENGELKASFGEDDELWVPLDEDGEALRTAPTLRATELREDGEYETLANAIDLGLRRLGDVSWREVHDRIE